MLNLNAKKLRRMAIVLAMVAAAMMMILTAAVFADSGDAAAAGDAAVAAAATTTGLKLQESLSDSLHAEAPSEWVFSVPRLRKVFQGSRKQTARSVQASCSVSYS